MLAESNRNPQRQKKAQAMNSLPHLTPPLVFAVVFAVVFAASIVWFVAGMLICRFLIVPRLISPIEEKFLQDKRYNTICRFTTAFVAFTRGPLGWIFYAGQTVKSRGFPEYRKLRNLDAMMLPEEGVGVSTSLG